jgi:hypothetical protein
MTEVFDVGEDWEWEYDPETGVSWSTWRCPRCGSGGMIRAHFLRCFPPEDPANAEYWPLLVTPPDSPDPQE